MAAQGPFTGDEIPHYAGTLRGIRALELFPDGELHSPQHEYVWKRGENKARCSYDYGMTYGWGDEVPVPHQVAALDCSCGFYHYFNERRAKTYMPTQDGVYAITESYGRITYGDQGFRAEKTKIVAVAARVDSSSNRPIRPGEPGESLLSKFIWLFATIALIGGILCGIFLSPWYFFSCGVAVLLWASDFALFSYESNRMDRFRHAHTEWLLSEDNVGYSTRDDWLRAAMRKYKEVQFFDSREEMLKAFPLTGAEEIHG